MPSPHEFDFGSSSVAAAYDTVLVPAIFEPWAESLLAGLSNWDGCTVLDLATGTGIVAQLAAGRVGPNGRVIGTDLNTEMLAQARRRYAKTTPAIEFSEAAGPTLAAADESIDFVLCQQGFQFFPDLAETAREIHRVLRPGGRLAASTWAPADECAFFGWICQSLAEIGAVEIEAVMRLPFDHMPPDKLRAPFIDAGFANASVERQSIPLMMPGGAHAVLKAVYATPIGPPLEDLPAPKRDAFDAAFLRIAESEQVNESTLGNLTAHVLRASKSR